MISDFHMHTNWSSDSPTRPKDMVREAIRKQMDAICITDHQDIGLPYREGEMEARLDIEPYLKSMFRLKEHYKDRIDVRIGIELGLQRHLCELYTEMVKNKPFDFIIGSGHVFDGMDPCYDPYFDDKTDEEGYRHAFEITLENIKRFTNFDVLGHIDYVVRYGSRQEKSYSYKQNAEVLDEIMKHLISNGKGIEINTAGWKYGLPFAHPHKDVIKRYRELGGEIITVGSDAHRPEHVGYDFHKVGDLLQECGFKYYTEFKERKPIFRQLT